MPLPITRRRWLSCAVGASLSPLTPWRGRLGAAASVAGPAAARPGSAGAAGALPWPPQLARSAAPAVDPQGWLVSEKLDGVRVLWDGHRLWLRGGTLLAAPAAFVSGLPAAALDGELWAGRGRFAAVAAAVPRGEPRAPEWAALRLLAFDLPLDGGVFAERARRLAALAAARAPSAPWDAVAQDRVADTTALARRLAAVVAAGGEGLVLHRADALHRGGRSGAVLKLKPLDDAEAVVVGHEPGRGRHAGRLGALRVRTADGVDFRLGTGFSDADREQPPPPGAWVTFTHRGLTAGGVPRFASYLRPFEGR